MPERTLVMIKPDGVPYTREILGRLDACGSRRAELGIEFAPRHIIEQFYLPHRGKPFYPWQVDAIAGKRVHLAIYAGEGIISKIREAIGDTDPIKAGQGTIRGDFSQDSLERSRLECRAVNNVVHASDSPEEVKRELRVWRPAIIDELVVDPFRYWNGNSSEAD